MSLSITFTDQNLTDIQAAVDLVKAKTDDMEANHPSIKMTALHVALTQLSVLMEDLTGQARGTYYGSMAFLASPSSGGGPKGA